MFVIVHRLKQDVRDTADSREEKKGVVVVSKVTRDGRLVISRFVPQTKTQELSSVCYLALDSDDRVFVAEADNRRVILLNSDLSSIRILCPTEDEDVGTIAPHRLCYDKVERQLVVAGFFRGDGLHIYSIDIK